MNKQLNESIILKKNLQTSHPLSKCSQTEVLHRDRNLRKLVKQTRFLSADQPFWSTANNKTAPVSSSCSSWWSGAVFVWTWRYSYTCQLN